MRGTLYFRLVLQYQFRITPAYAWNTFFKISEIRLQVGSPPLTRGTLHSSDSRNLLAGITPAYAGNTRL